MSNYYYVVYCVHCYNYVTRVSRIYYFYILPPLVVRLQISGFASNWRRLRQVVRERVIRGACRPLGAYSLSINTLNTKRPSFDLLTSGVRSGIRRRNLPGEPIKNGDNTRRPGDGGGKNWLVWKRWWKP